jgi:Mn-dependent DtxR family transcriptional regulator
MEIRQSSEDYLEAILMLHNRKGVVRSIDIAEELSVTKPSVSVAMKKLRTNGYIEMDEYGFISLLDKGREIAEKMYERHTFLSKWLASIGVDPEVAADDACKIEHVISAETFEAMKKHFSEN